MPPRHEVFSALGDPTRLEIVERLVAGGAQPTGPLLHGFKITRQAAAKHLAALERAGIVRSRPVGREVMRELDPAVLNDARDWLADRAAAWESALGRLQKFLEE